MCSSCATAVCTRRCVLRVASHVNIESIYRGMVQMRE
jgi:hypothetical protein